MEPIPYADSPSLIGGAAFEGGSLAAAWGVCTPVVWLVQQGFLVFRPFPPCKGKGLVSRRNGPCTVGGGFRVSPFDPGEEPVCTPATSPGLIPRSTNKGWRLGY